MIGSFLYAGRTAPVEGQSQWNIYRTPFFLLPGLLLLANVVACVIRSIDRERFRGFRLISFVAMHLGIVLVIVGLGLDGLYGSVSTRLYRLRSPDPIHLNWQTGREESFPFVVTVLSADTLNHPLEVQVEVVKQGGTSQIHPLREGMSFVDAGTGLKVKVGRFDIATKTLSMEVAQGGGAPVPMTATPDKPASVGGASVAPVAFKDPEPSEHRVKLRFDGQGVPPFEAVIGSNSPVRHAGYTFSLTQNYVDPDTNSPVVGLQMTRKPGEFLWWAGTLMVVVFLPLLHLARVRGGAIFNGLLKKEGAE